MVVMAVLGLGVIVMVLMFGLGGGGGPGGGGGKEEEEEEEEGGTRGYRTTVDKKRLVSIAIGFGFLMGLWEAFLNWLRSFFFKQEMELSLIGLQNAGKTSLVNVIATGGYSEDMIPTVGFNMRKVTKGNVTIKMWDLGGQPRFRSMWERYCRAVSAIVYVLTLDLNGIPDREVCCFMISCKNSSNIDTVIGWLVNHSKVKN
ncbi:hypothetical protein C3L33_21011, partial [Rhododendron williamsianum]